MRRSKRLSSITNSTEDRALPEKTVIELFDQRAAETPDAVAVVHEGRSMTYRELARASEKWAGYLSAKGCGRGTRVGVHLRRSPEMIIAVLGTLRAGGAYVPLDPRHPEERVQTIASDAELTLILADESPANPRATGIEWVNMLDAELPEAAADCPAPELSDVAYVMYTSGSTGNPKGVEIRHTGLSDYIEWARDSYLDDRPTTFAFFTSLSFDLTVTSLFLPLISGGRMIVFDQDTEEVDSSIIRVIADPRVEFVKLTPSHLSLMRHLDCSQTRIKTMIVGGEELRRETAVDVMRQLPDVTIYNEYGPTEAVVGCMIHRFDPEMDLDAGVPIGRPAAHTRLYLLNDCLQPVPEGCFGELYIARHGLASEYLNRPELSQERFVENPFREGERMYRTGDLGRFTSQGVMTYGGRCDDQIKLHGVRIEPGEIESAILSIEGIQGATVAQVELASAPDLSDADRQCRRCGVGGCLPGGSLDETGLCDTCAAYEKYGERARHYFRSMTIWMLCSMNRARDLRTAIRTIA